MTDCPTGILISFEEDDVKSPQRPNRLLTYSIDQEPSKFNKNLTKNGRESSKSDRSFSLDCSSTSLLEDQNINLIPSAGNDDEIFVIPSDEKTNVKKNKNLSTKQMVELFTEASKVAARFQFLSATQDKENILPSVVKSPQFVLNIPDLDDYKDLDDSVFTRSHSPLPTSPAREFSSHQSTNVDKKDDCHALILEPTSVDLPASSETFDLDNSKNTPENFPEDSVSVRPTSNASSSSFVSTEGYDVLGESDSVKLKNSNCSTMPLIKKSALRRPGFADRSSSGSSLSSCCSTEEIAPGRIGALKPNSSNLQKSMSLHLKSRNQIKPVKGSGPMKAFAQPKSLAPRKTQSFRDVPSKINQKPVTPSVKTATDKANSSTPVPAKSKFRRSMGTPVRSNWTPKTVRENSEFSSTPARKSTVTTSTPVASHVVRRRSLLATTPKSSCSSINSQGSTSSFSSIF